MARIGCLTVGSIASPVAQELIGALHEGLRRLGYVEGRNVVFEYGSAEGKIERLRERAADLVRLKVDLIAAFSNAAVHAARQVTTTIPIVSFNLGDPVNDGLAVSLARPGGNITGSTVFAPELVPKQLELLKQAVPYASRVAALWSPGSLTEASATDMLKKAEVAASRIGADIELLRFRAAEEIEGAFAAMSRSRSHALLVLPSPLSNVEGKRIAALATRSRLPSMSWNRYFVEVGGLMAYGSSLTESWKRGAIYVDRILKGASPSDLPIEQPTTFELIINTRTAKVLGLTIPTALLVLADQVLK